MNSKAFSVLFINALLLACVRGFGSLTTVVNGASVMVPLLTASNPLGMTLAVLGVLKLGAAALILGAGAAAPEPAGYDGRSRRYQRSAEGVTGNKDALFALIRSLDQLECGKSLICELEAMNQEDLLEDELLILTLFSDRKQKKVVDPASAKAEYDLAAELGLASKNQLICRQRYATCPYTASELMKALRQSHL